MNSQERFAVVCGWNAVCVFGALYYLTGSIIKAGIIAVFVYFSCLLNYGLRWILPGGFAVTILAIAVALGFPAPEQWPGLFHSASELVSRIWTHLASNAR